MGEPFHPISDGRRSTSNSHSSVAKGATFEEATSLRMGRAKSVDRRGKLRRSETDGET